MPNLAAVKTTFIYGGSPIVEKTDVAENYVAETELREEDFDPSLFFSPCLLYPFRGSWSLRDLFHPPWEKIQEDMLQWNFC